MKRPVKIYDAELREAWVSDEDNYALTGIIYNDTKNHIPDGTEITDIIRETIYKDDKVISYSNSGIRYLVIKRELKI